MRAAKRALVAALALGVAIAVAPPSPADAHEPELTEFCSPVQVRGLALKKIEAKGISCGDARHQIRTWLDISAAPDHPIDEVGLPEHRLGYWCPDGAGDLGRTWRCPLGDAVISFRPVLAPPLSRCTAFEGGSSGVFGAFPRVSEMYVHGGDCGPARDLIRFWFEHPQGDFGAYFPSRGPWWCGRPQPDLPEPNPSGQVGCSFADGSGTTAYMRFELIAPPDDAEGGLFGAFVGPGTAIEKTEDLGTFNFVTCTADDCRGRRYLTVQDELANGASVLVEVWWGGKLRNVCWDNTRSFGAAECTPRVPLGRKLTLFIAEGLKREWDRCWRRRNDVWVAPDGPCGKLKHRWAGPGRIGTPPADAGPIVWGEGDFHARG
ncbi:MAG: hypothetical protein GEU88_04835 [Solirubrobacterales bacterium]|nr:hypothetical protein [Solirubrobacterales bacterium]